MTELFDFPVEETKDKKKPIISLVAVALVALSAVLWAPLANAWQTPKTETSGAVCQGAERTPLVWTVTNLETGYSGSPATIEDVVVAPNYPTTTFTPQPLANTGNAKATAQTNVPGDYQGEITLKYTMVWSGTNGGDKRSASKTVLMVKCGVPITTTTTASTTTTVKPTTTTQATTTTTEATTTTTEATTTTTESTTTTSQVTTTTQQPTTTLPETTTTQEVTVPTTEPSDTVVPTPGAPATPKFTG